MNKNHLNSFERSETVIAWALLFAAGAVLALLLTFGGVHWLLEQVTASGNFKSGVVTTVLGLGLVLIGPVLLLAVMAILPRWWVRSVKAAIRKLLFGTSPK